MTPIALSFQRVTLESRKKEAGSQCSDTGMTGEVGTGMTGEGGAGMTGEVGTGMTRDGHWETPVIPLHVSAAAV
ncbi:hypothetical protein [Wolbachia endosymbiont of Cantharis cryptica]|uniref:hypothetical protein n=1 Tax=Wolbachia endosymbiont of Cantharis cryptica TaxID=3066132 RepID=UPI00376F1AC0